MVVVRDCRGRDVSEMVEILKGCWEDQQSERGGEIVSLRKIVITGGRTDEVLDWVGFFGQVLKKGSKVGSLCITGMNVGYGGAVQLARIIEGARPGGGNVKGAGKVGPATSLTGSGGGEVGGIVMRRTFVYSLQELILDDCWIPSWGLLPLLMSLADNGSYRISKLNLSNNNLGDSVAAGRALRGFVGSSEALTSVVLKGCNLGTITEGGYECDYTVTGLLEGVGDWNEKVKESLDEERRVRGTVEVKRCDFEDIVLEGNTGIGDAAMEGVGKMVERMGGVGREVGWGKVVRVGFLNLGGCSMGSRGCGVVAEGLLRLTAEGGGYGKKVGWLG